MKLIFLSDAFYDTYANCREIERKTNRPYAQIQITVDGVLWGIPLRSHIKHNYAIWTDKENQCGIDLSKAVVIADPDRFIQADIKPHIRENEFRELKRINESWVAQKLRLYIMEYKEAKRHPEISRCQRLVHCSTLQYFEEYIGNTDGSSSRSP